MNTAFKRIILIIPLLLGSFFLFAQPGNYISLKQRTEILENKNKLTTDLDLFYDKDKLNIRKHS